MRYDKEVVAQGGAFYDSESVDFGCKTPEPTGEPTRRPTHRPTPMPVKATSGGVQFKPGSGNKSPYRCVANPLVQAGYVVSEKFCDKFTDCYNHFIGTKDFDTFHFLIQNSWGF